MPERSHPNQQTSHHNINRLDAVINSDVNKDLTLKDKEKDQTLKAKDQDKE